MARRDPDEVLVALFKNHASLNNSKSVEAGRPIFDDIEVVEIRAPGSKDFKVFPATAFSHWETDIHTGEQSKVTYAERFRHQYQQFRAKTAQTKSGTPLEYVPFMTEGKRAEMRAQNIYTVEALAAIDGAELEEPRHWGAASWKNAWRWNTWPRPRAARAEPVVQPQNELEQLRARNAILEEDNAAKKARRGQRRRRQ